MYRFKIKPVEALTQVPRRRLQMAPAPTLTSVCRLCKSYPGAIVNSSNTRQLAVADSDCAESDGVGTVPSRREISENASHWSLYSILFTLRRGDDVMVLYSPSQIEPSEPCNHTGFISTSFPPSSLPRCPSSPCEPQRLLMALCTHAACVVV